MCIVLSLDLSFFFFLFLDKDPLSLYSPCFCPSESSQVEVFSYYRSCWPLTPPLEIGYCWVLIHAAHVPFEKSRRKKWTIHSGPIEVMGNFHSIQSRTGRRRTNRLSKPLTNKACLSPISRKSPPAKSNVPSPVSPGSASRKEPLRRTSVPVSPPVSNCNGLLSQSLPSTTSQPEAPRRASAWNESIAEEEIPDENQQGFPSPSPSTSASVSRRSSLRPTRRASFQPEALRDASQSGSTPGQPKRSYSLQSHPQSSRGTIYEDSLEEATSSNTYFMVDNQRFSITRRRSLLTRPGVATRKSSRQSVRRLSPPISQGAESPSGGPAEKRTSLQSPPPENEDATVKSAFASVSARPDTPSDFEYTHLGALKLGSLRVVNGSASPSSSDRTRSNNPRSTSPELPSDSAETRESTVIDHAGEASDRKLNLEQYPTHPENVSHGHGSSVENTSNLASNETSMLQVSTSPATKTQQDAPGSPFSFEKSPTIAAFPRHGSLFTQEDEAISIRNERSPLETGASLLWKTHMRPHNQRGCSQSLAKADSGYSSAASVRSSQDKPTRESLDSQRPDRQSGGSRKASVCSRPGRCEDHSVTDSLGLNYVVPMQRHSTLRASKCDRSQRTPPDTLPRNPRFADSRAFRRVGSFSRPFGPLNSLEFSVTDPRDVPLPQRQRAGSIGGGAPHSYQECSSSRLLRHKSMSVTGPGEQRIHGTTKKNNTRSFDRFNEDAPGYDRFDYRLQMQSIHRSATTRTKHPKQTRADMVNERYHQPNDNLNGKAVSPGHSTDFALRKSISFLEKMEPVEEKDYGTLPGRLCDRVRHPNTDDQQRKYARPVKRRSLYMSTSPFIFK